MFTAGKEVHSKQFSSETARLNSEELAQSFQELSSEKIQLFAAHLTRPWNLVQILHSGYLGASADLPSDQIRTHRGYYMGWDKAGIVPAGINDDISFNVGVPQRLYAQEDTSEQEKKWMGGIGFVMPYSDLKEKYTTKIKFGGFRTARSLEKIKDTPLMEPQFFPYTQLSRTELSAMDTLPRTEDFGNLIHITRKAGELNGGDQAEVGVISDQDGPPKISLHDVKILLPENRRAVLLRYLRMTTMFLGKAATDQRSSQDLFDQYPNIYWYPQENISDAIKYLSIAPEEPLLIP